MSKLAPVAVDDADADEISFSIQSTIRLHKGFEDVGRGAA